MAENKSSSMEEIGKQLEQGVRDLFTTEQYTIYLKAMDKFHEYSFNNQVLIAAQRPDATLVAGYKSWENNFNRHVKKGEKGIRIIAPVPVKKKTRQERRDAETGRVILLPDGTPQTEEVERIIPRFRSVTVFDVSQTEGEPLPERPGVQTLTAGVDRFDSFMRAIRKACPVPIRFKDISGTANGYYDPQAKEIVIRPGMSESQTVKTAIHETVHARLHDPDNVRNAGRRTDQVTREVEAESTAYLICHHFGIDTGAYTFPYIAAWSSSVEMKELRQSMSLVCDTASEIIGDMTSQMELEQERKSRIEYGDVNVHIGFSEHPLLQTGAEGLDMSFAAADSLLRTLDEKNPGNDGYDKTDFTVKAVVDGREYSYAGRFDIGSEHGGLADHIRGFVSFMDQDTGGLPDTGRDLADVKEKILPAIERNMTLTEADREQVRKILDGETRQYDDINGRQTGGLFRYYSTQRPVDLGTYPKPDGNRPVEIVNFDCDSRIPVENEPFNAWGYLEYKKPLTEEEYQNYELKPATYDHAASGELSRDQDALPPQCYSVLPSTGELIIIKRGESGYYRTSQEPGDREENRALADRYNEEHGVTREQEEALAGDCLSVPDSGREEPSGRDAGTGTPGSPGKSKTEQEKGDVSL